MFMNELGPDFGGGTHFVYEQVPKGKCSMLLSGDQLPAIIAKNGLTSGGKSKN